MGGKGSGGHNKKSIDEHLRTGTYRPDRHGPLPKLLTAKRQTNNRAAEPKKEVKKVAKTPDIQPVSLTAKAPIKAPGYFDEIACAEWERVCQILYDLGTLQDVNHATLEGYCSAYSKAVRADQVLNEKGFTYEVTIFSKQGDVCGTAEKKRHEVDISRQNWQLVKVFAVELGITQSSGKVRSEDTRSELEKALDEALGKK